MLKPYQKTLTGRNNAIRRLYASKKWTLEMLSKKYGITRARVHQIIHKV